MARILEALDEDHARVEVLRVLKGDYEPGQQVRMAVYGARRRVGETLVLGDAECFLAPSFNLLPLAHEPEVSWLVSRPPPRSVGGAILRAQGYSHESRHAAAAFLGSCTPFPAGRVLEAIERSRAAGADRAYETECLVDVLMLRPHPAAASWVRERVRAWLAAPEAATGGSELAERPSRGCRFLTALVGACGDTWSPMFFGDGRERAAEVRSLRDELEVMLLGTLRALDESTLADVTYALVWTKTSTVAQVLARVPGAARRNGVAVGLLRVGRSHDRICGWDDAREVWREARAAATRPELIAWLDEALAARR